MPEVWEGGNEADVCRRCGRVGTRLMCAGGVGGWERG